MKRSYIFGVLLSLCLTSFFSFMSKPKYFEGLIIYKVSYVSENPTVTVERLIKDFGDTTIFYFKEGNYVQTFNGSLMKMNYRNSSNNLFCVETFASDSVECIDCSISDEMITSKKIVKKQALVAGFTCNKLMVTSNDLKGKPKRQGEYYYNSSLRINPKWFENDKLGSHNVVYGLMRSMPLKIVTTLYGVTVTMTAIEVRQITFKEDLRSKFSQ